MGGKREGHKHFTYLVLKGSFCVAGHWTSAERGLLLEEPLLEKYYDNLRTDYLGNESGNVIHHPCIMSVSMSILFSQSVLFL